MARNPKPLRNRKNGQFQGSIGGGKTFVPTAVQKHPSKKANQAPNRTLKMVRDPRDPKATLEDAKQAAMRRGISKQLSWYLVEHTSPSVRVRLAENVYTHPTILQELALDEILQVRVAVAENPNCPAQAVEELITWGGPEVPAALRQNLILKDRWEAWVAEGKPNLQYPSRDSEEDTASFVFPYNETPMALTGNNHSDSSTELTFSDLESSREEDDFNEDSLSLIPTSGGLAQYLRDRGEQEYNAYGMPLD